jgi:hypothetical protein
MTGAPDPRCSAAAPEISAVGLQQIDNAEIARLADTAGLIHHGPQHLRHSRAGIEKIHIDGARTVVAGRHGLRNASIFAGPADAPFVHGADAVRPVLAQQLRQQLIAKAAAGRKRIIVMMAPMVRRLRAERDRNCHLRHHRGTATAN